MSGKTIGAFDEMCLKPVDATTPENNLALRLREMPTRTGTSTAMNR